MQRTFNTHQCRINAVKAVRGFIREIGFDPDKVSANYAAYTLEYLSATEPDLIAARYFRTADAAQMKLFKVSFKQSQSPVKK